jgi:hypothetical protein
MAGKLQWIRDHMPSWIQGQIFITTHKHLLGKPGYVLVDDRQDTLNDFANLGGTPVVIPRPWNCMWNVRNSPSFSPESQIVRAYKKSNTKHLTRSKW